MAGRGTDIALASGVASLGGLHVILTEFHEAARIDRQLFGRCARQGDPGSHEAIVALDDEIFRRHARGLAELCDRTAITASGVAPGWCALLLRRQAQAAAEAANSH